MPDNLRSDQEIWGLDAIRTNEHPFDQQPGLAISVRRRQARIRFFSTAQLPVITPRKVSAAVSAVRSRCGEPSSSKPTINFRTLAERSSGG